MNKIGIFTYHHITNNGAFLQALSLQSFLKEKGYDVELVHYQPAWVMIREYSKIIRPLFKGQFTKAKTALKKWNIFQKAIRENMIVSENAAYTSKGSKKLAQQYQTLICGSDEIWNTSGFLKYNPSYFLDFPADKNQKRLSYAASIGQANPTPEELSRAKNALSQYDAILVRDKYTHQWVKDLLDNTINPVKVVDPTLLYNVETILPQEKDYVLITGMLSSSQVKIAISFAREKGLEVISAGYSYSGYTDQAREIISPLEWAGYAQNAAYHFTSLFHGSIFSLKSNRPFAVLKNPSKGRKLEDLLETFSLEGHALYPNFSLADLRAAMNAGYPEAHNEHLQELQNQAAHALEAALL